MDPLPNYLSCLALSTTASVPSLLRGSAALGRILSPGYPIYQPSNTQVPNINDLPIIRQEQIYQMAIIGDA